MLHSLARQMEICEEASGMIESKIIWKLSQNFHDINIISSIVLVDSERLSWRSSFQLEDEVLDTSEL